ncbi:MAG: hypothetical protein OXG56_12725 [Gammaproteobacteria bacterium]|nr:hypothetical protein [Gammaproteobacteria bacterium]
MNEAILATFVFWSTFVFTIGPYWIGIMSAAKDTSFAVLYKNFLIYCLVSWFPLNAILGFIVGTVGNLHEGIYTGLYFVGAMVIFYLAYQTAQSRDGTGKGLDFNWKMMALVSWSSPKVWTTIPAGFLAATYTSNLYLNIVLFFLIGMPLFLFGVYFWGMIGRQGARLAKGKIAWVNAGLLAGFGVYLLYRGFLLVQGV